MDYECEINYVLVSLASVVSQETNRRNNQEQDASKTWANRSAVPADPSSLKSLLTERLIFSMMDYWVGINLDLRQKE